MAPTVTIEDLRAEISGLPKVENKPMDWKMALAIGLPTFFGVIDILGVVVWSVWHKMPRDHPVNAILWMYHRQMKQYGKDMKKYEKEKRRLEKKRKWSWPWGIKNYVLGEILFWINAGADIVHPASMELEEMGSSDMQPTSSLEYLEPVHPPTAHTTR
ncbi:uncharacterized protein N7496_006262 [Penicillium cataractarum]|uniref:Uncharacterized protein n=1 Tax=Penicillium cataractarum TaxID=2100454 RepID=A0A9W9S2L2_9EURO|nr:uncharacterized protein N7496_006262 [Penicillium cataractarum]KAJ5370170.1 hypothetical protein N7496_006262 [Penicillium cataractarum]